MRFVKYNSQNREVEIELSRKEAEILARSLERANTNADWDSPFLSLWPKLSRSEDGTRRRQVRVSQAQEILSGYQSKDRSEISRVVLHVDDFMEMAFMLRLGGIADTRGVKLRELDEFDMSLNSLVHNEILPVIQRSPALTPGGTSNPVTHPTTQSLPPGN